jgi:hypothetical protein
MISRRPALARQPGADSPGHFTAAEREIEIVHVFRMRAVSAANTL